MRIKIAKEAKEAQYWLKLLRDFNDKVKPEAEELIEEAGELSSILFSIITKTALKNQIAKVLHLD